MSRCRPGDLAIITRASFPENLGKLVHVVERSPLFDIDGMHWIVEPLFVVSRALLPFTNELRVGPAPRLQAPDAWLRPLRDGDGADETLEWVSLPQGVAA